MKHLGMLALALTAVFSVAGAASGQSPNGPATNVPVPSNVDNVAWVDVPTCLNAKPDNHGAGTIAWESTTQTVRTAQGLFGIRYVKMGGFGDEVALTLDGGVVIKSSMDEQGISVPLSNSSIELRALPDCSQPLYLFIREWNDAEPGEATDWVIDAGRSTKTSESFLIEFPADFGAHTVLNLQGGVLTVTNEAPGRSATAYRYHADPVYAFIETGVQPTYLSVVDKPNDDFFENVEASNAVLKTVGKPLFDDLHASTGLGETNMFGGRYLIVAGSMAYNSQRHGVVVVDVVSNAVFWILCEDFNHNTGTLVRTSQATKQFIANNDNAVLNAFRSVGFNLKWDEKDTLSCDGDCHSEQ